MRTAGRPVRDLDAEALADGVLAPHGVGVVEQVGLAVERGDDGDFVVGNAEAVVDPVERGADELSQPPSSTSVML